MYSAERQFVATAHNQLCLLEQDELHAHHIFKDALGEIKRAAGPVKARAIYRAALLCEDVLKRCTATSTKFQTSLNGLKSLVELYANGLYEIDPGFKLILLGKTTSVADETPPKVSAKEILEQLKAANENAANVLHPLLHLVKDDKRAHALSFLAGIGLQAGGDVATPRPNTYPRTRSNVRFDVLMRRITNHTLGEARALAKNVSISYAADFENVDTSIATSLQNFLQTACLEIVRSGLVVNGDLAASINRTWQISITGETRGQDLSITLSWLGEALLDFGSTGESEKLRLGLNGKLTAQSEQKKLKHIPNRHVLELVCPARKSKQAEQGHQGHIDISPPQAREA